MTQHFSHSVSKLSTLFEFLNEVAQTVRVRTSQGS